jgi:hypothetical protein
MHRHGPKRHAVLSFVVAREGCNRLGQETDHSGSEPENTVSIANIRKSSA